jgi:plasmid stabilization system protein ParE
MVYRVKLMPRAQKDVENLYQWVIRRAPHQGALWYEGLVETMKTLAQHPQRGSLAPESLELQAPVRQLLYGARPYRILYWIVKNEVQILHVRRGARKHAGPITTSALI